MSEVTRILSAIEQAITGRKPADAAVYDALRKLAAQNLVRKRRQTLQAPRSPKRTYGSWTRRAATPPPSSGAFGRPPHLFAAAGSMRRILIHRARDAAEENAAAARRRLHLITSISP